LHTSGTTAKIEGLVKEMLGEKVKMIYTRSGSDNNSSLSMTNIKGENSASIRVGLKDEFSKETEQDITTIGNYIKSIPDIKVSFKRDETALQSSLGTAGAPFSLEISGKDHVVIKRIIDESKELLADDADLYNITTSIDDGTPEVEVAIDRFRASYYNVSSVNIINQIKGYLSGTQAGSFEKDGELKDVIIKPGDLTLHQLNDLPVTAGSIKVPLSELAEINTVISPGEITRRNQVRTSYIYAGVRTSSSFDKVIKNAQDKLHAVVLPVDYKMEFTGEELKRKESTSNLSFALTLSLILVFMVLAAQFESVVQPFVIMLTIPLAGIGTVLTFFLLDKTLNMMAYIGIIMLGGIAVNNAILLIDRINQLRDKGLTKKEAIVLAGSQRIRPILMTSLTTILALVPLTIGIGDSASLRAPMALAVIGGMLSSTLLTLIVIPCVYWVIDSFSGWLMSKTKAK
jgi:HAE1 family hydrophobic/amphiphilic exporter-1